jgi:hypothetical protein
MAPQLTGANLALVRLWMERSIEALSASPPTPQRDRALRHFRERLSILPKSNVVPLHGRAQ